MKKMKQKNISAKKMAGGYLKIPHLLNTPKYQSANDNG